MSSRSSRSRSRSRSDAVSPISSSPIMTSGSRSATPTLRTPTTTTTHLRTPTVSRVPRPGPSPNPSPRTQSSPRIQSSNLDSVSSSRKSPRPGYPLQASPRPPTFLPPSHYAQAAASPPLPPPRLSGLGFEVPMSTGGGGREESLKSKRWTKTKSSVPPAAAIPTLTSSHSRPLSPSRSSSLKEKVSSLYDDSHQHQQQQGAAVWTTPTSSLKRWTSTRSSSSPSPHDQDTASMTATPTTLKRWTTRSSSAYSSSPSSTSSPRTNRRLSQEFNQVEAQLVPSLRDTIDRMTRPPPVPPPVMSPSLPAPITTTMTMDTSSRIPPPKPLPPLSAPILKSALRTPKPTPSRFRNLLLRRRSKSSLTGAIDSEVSSDSTYHYERLNRQSSGSKLIVANAAAAAASSDDSSSMPSSMEEIRLNAISRSSAADSTFSSYSHAQSDWPPRNTPNLAGSRSSIGGSRSTRVVSFQSNSTDSIYSLDLHVPSTGSLPSSGSLSSSSSSSSARLHSVSSRLHSSATSHLHSSATSHLHSSALAASGGKTHMRTSSSLSSGMLSDVRRRNDLIGLVNDLDLEMRRGMSFVGGDSSADEEVAVWEAKTLDEDERQSIEVVWRDTMASRSFSETSSTRSWREEQADEDRPTSYYAAVVGTRETAARERRAMGIPPSQESIVVDLGGSVGGSSSSGSIVWEYEGESPVEEVGGGWSRGAEMLFSGIQDDDGQRVGAAIRELYDLEVAYTTRLSVVVNLFILPLRAKNSKTWISGIPASVSSLLDWLEDIYQLHLDLMSMLASGVLDGVGLREGTVLRLEVYLPFLVHVEKGWEGGGEFDEFVRIQEEKMGGTGSLMDVLTEPGKRIGTLADDFLNIAAAMRKEKEGYVNMLRVARTTETMVKVMEEVRRREERYEEMRSLFPLVAKRDRRVLMVVSNEDDVVVCNDVILAKGRVGRVLDVVDVHSNQLEVTMIAENGSVETVVVQGSEALQAALVGPMEETQRWLADPTVTVIGKEGVDLNESLSGERKQRGWWSARFRSVLRESLV